MKYFSILTLVLILSSCGQQTENKIEFDANQIHAAMIEVELKDSTSLFIMLAKDGTVNRKGDLKTKDNNFFMGISNNGLLENFTKTITNDISDYLNRVHVLADTAKNVNKIKVGFSGPNGDTGFEYYTNEAVENLPKPILNLITNAIQVTDPWFRVQQAMLKPN